MRFLKPTLFVSSVFLATSSFAQVGASISVLGALAIGEGGAARVHAFVESTVNGPVGRFHAVFTQGELRDLRMLNATSISAPGLTAFFGGDAIGTVVRHGRSQYVRGTMLVMVDDLNHPEFPDQFFLEFRLPDGQRIIRHGLMRDGDIVVNFR